MVSTQKSAHFQSFVVSLTCALSVVSIGLAIYLYSIYQEEVAALASAFASGLSTAFSSFWDWLAVPFAAASWWLLGLPNMVIGFVVGAFFWCLCVTRNLKRKGLQGRYYSAVKKGSYFFLALFLLRLYSECVKSESPIESAGAMTVIFLMLLLVLSFFCLIFNGFNAGLSVFEKTPEMTSEQKAETTNDTTPLVGG